MSLDLRIVRDLKAEVDARLERDRFYRNILRTRVHPSQSKWWLPAFKNAKQIGRARKELKHSWED